MDRTGTGRVLSAIQIQKLGHRLEEIRLRALNNVMSKLEYGFISEKELIDRKDLVVKLLDWFSFETFPEAEKVLNLILRLVKADMDGTLNMHIKSLGGYRALDAVRTRVEPKLLCLIDEIVNAVDRSELDSNLTETQDNNSLSCDRQEPNQGSVGSTATPIEVQVEEEQQVEGLESSPTEVLNQPLHGYISSGDTVPAARHTAYSQGPDCFQCLVFPWQPLVATDRHVLLAVEESLASTTDLPLILHTCQFFTDVMLRDFPAEVFLHRPAVLKMFLDLLDSDSDRRVCEAVACCLCRLTVALQVRVRYYSDPGIANLKQVICSTPDSNLSSPSYTSSHSFVTLTRDRPVMGQHLNSDTAQRNQDSTVFQGYPQNVPSEAGYSSETAEDSVLLQLQQLSLPHYCLLCLSHCVPRLGPSTGPQRQYPALLAAELVKLLAMCMKSRVWSSSDPVALEVKEHMQQVLLLLGDVLESHRSGDVIEDANKLTYLQLLALTRKLLVAIVPVSIADSILHRKLKSALSRSLLDLSVITLFPTLHADILQYVKEFHMDLSVKYESTMAICASMKSAVRFLKNYDKLERELFDVLDESLASLPFHENLDVVKHCIEMAVNKPHLVSLDESNRKVVTGVILKLLAHSEPHVKLEMYGCCHKYVVAILGVQQVPRTSADSLRQLDFLFDTAVLIEIICHGAASLEKKIQLYSEEMLIHLLKGKFLLPEPIWRRFLECLIPALPLLQCYADQTTSLGRAIVKIFDPGTSHSIHLPSSEVLKGNLRLLFCSDSLTREEAVSRITWLMAREERAYEKLPDFSSLKGVLLNSVCLTDRPVDFGHKRIQHHFYQVNSLCQVIELLKSKGTEPVVRRSALTQVSVMLEDSSLHDQFLEQDGVNLILDILHKALVDKERSICPDSVIPCISTLKSLVLYRPKLRLELSHNANLLSCILRAMYLYSGDDRLRPDSSVLLCLLLYSDFILSEPEPIGNSSPWHRFSLPKLVAQHMRLPFLCHTHWHSSPHTQTSVRRDLLKQEDCHALLRLCWNIEWFGGLEVVLSWSEVPSSDKVVSGFAQELRLLAADLRCLKAAALDHRCKQYLYDIQNATTHQAVEKSLASMSGYLAFHVLISGRGNCQLKSTSNFFGMSQLESSDWWHDLPWAETFKRFLGIPPGCTEDEQLLVSILKLLRLYLNVCWSSEVGAGELKHQSCWVTNILKDAFQPLPNLLVRLADVPAGSDRHSVVLKELCREILQLVQECSARERKLEDFGRAGVKKTPEGNANSLSLSWIHVIRVVTENLTLSDTQHFYNLAYLDWMLSCLAQLTSVPNWGDHAGGSTRQLWGELISCLTELVTAFHCCKGGDSQASFMGLSITRSAVLCMNHLLCDMQLSTTTKGWEAVWLCSLGAESHAAGHPNLSWLPPLWSSRDPVVRSAALQLVAGFCSSRQGCAQLLPGLPAVAGSIWSVGLSIMLEHDEACLVREQAAVLLTNLSSHSISTSGGGAMLSLCHTAANSEEVPVTGVQAVQLLLTQCNFYGEVATVLSRLYMGSTVNPSGTNGTCDWTVECSSRQHAPPEAGLQPDQRAVVYPGNTDSRSSNEHQVNADSSAPTESVTDGSSQLEPHVKTTPGLVKAVCWLMVNLLALSPDDALQHITRFGLVRLFFSCLVAGVPQKQGHGGNMLLYVDILEMCTAVCSVLSKCVLLDEVSHRTVLHTHNCVCCLLALLDHGRYSIHSPQLAFLRNRLWTEIFRLFSALLSRKQGFEAVQAALCLRGPWPFFTTLATAIQNDLSTDLRYSALTSLTSLLSHEIRKRSVPEEFRSVQNLLDCDFPLLEQDCHTNHHKLLKQFGHTHCEQYEVANQNEQLVDHRNMSELEEHMSSASTQEELSPQNQTAASKSKCDSGTSVKGHKDQIVGHFFSSSESKEKLISETSRSASVRGEPGTSRTDGETAQNQTVGAELCNSLLRLYEIHNLPQGSGEKGNGIKAKNLVTSALSSLLAVSGEAKKAALKQGLLEMLVVQLRELHVKLSIESAENLRRMSDKKRVCPVLRDVGVIFAMLTNFLSADGDVKLVAAELGLSDVVHKLWVWCCAVSSLLEGALKMLSTFTAACLSATQSLVLTTTVPGVGLRKTPSSLSLLHEIVSLIHREMEIINRAHESAILSLAFQLLTNSCQSQECRNVIAKSNLFQCLPKLHPSVTKKQKHWEAVELMWLGFMSDFTLHAEGQLAVPKITDALDLLIMLTASSRTAIKMAALCVLRNISFHQLNRPRLLGSGDFLQVLHQKLSDGSLEEKRTAACMVWALVANNQKGKLIIKCSGIDTKLQDCLNQLRLLSNSEDTETDEGIHIISNVLQIIHGDNSTARRR